MARPSFFRSASPNPASGQVMTPRFASLLHDGHWKSASEAHQHYVIVSTANFRTSNIMIKSDWLLMLKDGVNRYSH